MRGELFIGMLIGVLVLVAAQAWNALSRDEVLGLLGAGLLGIGFVYSYLARRRIRRRIRNRILD